jgi:uncharacterized caspase-like protein
MIKAILFLVASMLLLSAQILAMEGKTHRFALVIGNQNYTSSPLLNPINDAQAIATDLTTIGFDVDTVFDANGTNLKQNIENFYSKVAANKGKNILAVVYYAGHAIQVQHRNYIVPIDVKLGSYNDLLSTLYDINHLFRQIPQAPNMQNVIILDACRNNPFGEFKNNNGMPIIADGLAPLRAPPGTLIAYSTEPGSVAFDGKGKNGIYTKHLLEHINDKITVEEVFKKVRKGVAKETRKQQVPWEHSSLFGAVYINPPRNREVPELMTF